MSHRPRSPQPPRRRLDHSVYVRRRITFAAASCLVIVLLVIAAQGVLGDSGTKAAATTTSGTSTTVAATVTTTTAAVTTTTALADKPKTTATPQNPAELLVLGDSDAGAFAPFLRSLLDKTGVVDTTVDYKVSSGLSRPDFFDWPAHMHQVVPSVNPDIVVVTFGGNDAQGLRNKDKTWAVPHAPGQGANDDDWKAEYGRRVGAAMDYLGGQNRLLIWVGVPDAASDKFTARLKVQDAVVRAEALKRPGHVVYIDTWLRFEGKGGKYSAYAVDPVDGVLKKVRASDGFHLNVAGAKILALDIALAVRRELRNRGATL